MPTTRSAEPGFDHGRRRPSVVRAVLTDVFQGRLKAGDRLVTQTLAHRFGVSHTPIREALIELAGIGVVDLLPNRGAVVRRVTAKDVREVCQVRRSLECLATRHACGRVDRETLAGLGAESETLVTAGATPDTITQARDVDDRLHDAIAASCGNSFLRAELARLKTLFRAFRDVAWEQEEERKDYHRIGVEAREHLDLIRALEAADAKAAGRAMARHIRSGEAYWTRITTRLN
ncbi:GntR family transcriptional regulator [Urbifossiella limnaea]|uniref:Putative HTH-type transcriptional regulator YdfH n=1 Tax=Urbifossiella limnaea TaxID=2528023 RepID=A0A517XTJ5_9BACT|nr:GntR family transcriptional regulator [Urbifossiella limnaea]QDU20822.1 putative HTH-type transcriptional regulator YdfH [Urbifossiella limnaea]